MPQFWYSQVFTTPKIGSPKTLLLQAIAPVADLVA
jgi:hypothetical protein